MSALRHSPWGRRAAWIALALAGLAVTAALAIAASHLTVQRVGLAGAYAAAGLMTTLRFGVQPLDPATYALTTVMLGAIALCACSPGQSVAWKPCEAVATQRSRCAIWLMTDWLMSCGT